MLAVTTGATQSRPRMGTSVELGMRGSMTTETDIVPRDGGLFTERKYVTGSAACADVFADIAVAVETHEASTRLLEPLRVCEHRVRIARECGKFISVTVPALRLDDPRIRHLRKGSS